MPSIILALAMVAATISTQGTAPAAGPTPIPMVSGPITAPGVMFPGLREVPKGTAPEDLGYVANEYFVSGTAAGKPYTTRIVVRQPKDPKKFSGIVVSEVMHSSGNSWMFYTTRLYMINQGHIHVEIASQKAPTEASIIKANPERYKSLSIPEATQVNEITAQIGALIKANLSDGPFAGLKVRHSFLMGTSQSSGVLVQFLRQHALSRLADGGPIFDGFFPTSVSATTRSPKWTFRSFRCKRKPKSTPRPLWAINIGNPTAMRTETSTGSTKSPACLTTTLVRTRTTTRIHARSQSLVFRKAP